ncbi:hypothetical protein B0T10DRAFT_557250 [Thelonectria olida]|uniref:Survival Motor Neuron Gemin2-binding domain-containing protein n=1 Tax=Thelonectria olida TaxID=1576542 RepID=A0A9P8WH72_9HYPO|nr:hypothetical protein B0T10DRAFT_557250 [Thelonectria olida]
MGGSSNELSHEEIWDDSALIDSWNEALAEYKKYHSVHAKGGSVRDMEPTSKAMPKTKVGNSQPEETLDEGEAAGEAAVDEGDSTVAHEGPSDRGSKTTMGAFPVQAVLGSVKDESLKKLLMSWYYAGYYTGLFEGQQQAQHSQES